MTLTRIPVDHLTVGIDLGDKYSHYCELDAAGSILEEGRLATSPAAFQRRFGRRPLARIAIEAGTHSAWVARLLVECGHDVIIANPRKLRVIYENDRKTAGEFAASATLWTPACTEPHPPGSLQVRMEASRSPTR